MPWKRMNHGIGLKTHWPPQGLGQLCLSELQQQTPTQHTCTHGFISGFGFENLMSSSCFHLRSPMNIFPHAKAQMPHVDQRWPLFQLGGSSGSPRLVTAQGFSLACHKMSPDTKPSYSYQRTPTALPTNVTSFPFPPTTTTIKEKLNSPLPCQVEWNK